METAIAALRGAIQGVARQFALQGAAAILLLAGASFLTAALWLYLSQLRDALFASVTVGAGFVGVALVLMALARPRRRAPRASSEAEAPEGAGGVAGIAPLLDAFLFGFEVALRQRARDGRGGGEHDKRDGS